MDYWIVKTSAASTRAALAHAESIIEQIAREGVEYHEHSLLIELAARPNPFTNKVSISFSLQQTQQVSLEVYDMPGRVVATLYGEAQAGKDYSFELAGHQIKAGMYLVRVNCQSSKPT